MRAATLLFLHVCYAALALLAALWLERDGAGTLSQPALGGLVAFAMLLLGHETLSRRRQGRLLAGRIARQAERMAALDEANRALANELERLHRQAGGGTATDGGRLVNELRLLHGQLARLADRQGADPAADAMAARRRPAAGGAEPLDDRRMLELVREGLRENRVDLYLQPIVALPQRRPRHYEAYSRIRTADGRLLHPDRYLPLAEREGLTPALDNLLLFRCVQLVRRLHNRHAGAGFFVNLSPAALADGEFFEQFCDFLETNADLRSRLVFELTQDAAWQWPAGAGPLARLAGRGYRFSLDQVTGPIAAPGGLARHGVRYVKVPVETLLSGRIGEPAELAAVLDDAGIELVAERVEDERHVPELIDRGIRLGQGFLFGEPRAARSDDV